MALGGLALAFGEARLNTEALATSPLVQALSRHQVTLLLLLCLPALLDWAMGVFNPFSGSNLRRLASGALLGLALSRMVQLHLRRPFEGPVFESFLLLGSTALVILLLRWRLGETVVEPEVPEEPRGDSQFPPP